MEYSVTLFTQEVNEIYQKVLILSLIKMSISIVSKVKINISI